MTPHPFTEIQIQKHTQEHWVTEIPHWWKILLFLQFLLLLLSPPRGLFFQSHLMLPLLIYLLITRSWHVTLGKTQVQKIKVILIVSSEYFLVFNQSIEWFEILLCYVMLLCYGLLQTLPIVAISFCCVVILDKQRQADILLSHSCCKV